MRFGSVCSGIEAATVAFTGWDAAWLAEIEPFPCAVLSHRYPTVPNLGDMTTIAKRILLGEVEAPDVLCGGTPCQSFSIAGLRGSLSDDRGNLTLKFIEIANAIDHVRSGRGQQPTIAIWENVPGVLNTEDNAFGCFLAGLAGESVPLIATVGKWSNAGCVYGPARSIAWRVLDAKHFGVPQSRKRIFLVSSARKGFDPAEVLFEFGSSRRDSETSSQEARGVAPDPADLLGVCGIEQSTHRMINIGGYVEDDTAGTVKARDWKDATDLVAYNITFCDANGTRQDRRDGGVYINETQVSGSVLRGGAGTSVADSHSIRRLTVGECESLQGFPQGHTNVPWRGKPDSPDGLRYKALGNSWAVPVAAWVGKRVNEYLA